MPNIVSKMIFLFESSGVAQDKKDGEEPNANRERRKISPLSLKVPRRRKRMIKLPRRGKKPMISLTI